MLARAPLPRAWRAAARPCANGRPAAGRARLLGAAQPLHVRLACLGDAKVEAVVLLHGLPARLHLRPARAAKVRLPQALLQALEHAALACARAAGSRPVGSGGARAQARRRRAWARSRSKPAAATSLLVPLPPRTGGQALCVTLTQTAGARPARWPACDGEGAAVTERQRPAERRSRTRPPGAGAPG